MRVAIDRAVILGLAIASSSIGCLEIPGAGGGHASDFAGEVSVQLKVGNGTLNVIHYSMANATSSYQGTLDIADAASVLAVIGGIHAGAGYVLALSGTTSDGAPCQGLSTHFSVLANSTAVVGIDVRCRTLSSVGSGLSNCPCDMPGPAVLVSPSKAATR
jgi:hypothetical protein